MRAASGSWRGSMSWTEPARGRRGVALLAATVLACLVAMLSLSGSVISNLRHFDSANSDNVQWTLSQAEVEFLEFRRALTDAEGHPGDAGRLADVRARFDVFYSRIETLRQGAAYAGLSAIPDYAGALGATRGFLDEAVPLLDGGDEGLAEGMPLLLRRSAELRPAVRSLANSALLAFARQADEMRTGFRQTLFRLAIVTATLFGVLSVLAIHFNRLNKLSLRRGQDLLETNERMRTILSTSLDGVAVCDAQGRIIEFNGAAERIFGTGRGAVLGRSIGEVMVPPRHRAAHEQGMERMRRGEPPRVVGRGRVRMEALRADGTEFPAEIAIQDALLGGERVFIAFLRDISAQIAAEDELRRARDAALAGERAKAEFLAVMSHEIRTPLNGLLGNLSLLAETPLDAGQDAFVRAMGVSGRALMEHVNSVLDVTRLDAGRVDLRLRPMDLPALLREVADSQRAAAEAHGNRLAWGWTGAAPPLLLADAARLRQALLNLVGNAIRFTSDGEIRIEGEAAPAECGAAGELCGEIRVSDTGIGIEPERQARIFDDFVTSDAGSGRPTAGAGLGLGIVRRIVTLMQGTVRVESAPGRGTTFRLNLPLRPAAGAASPGATDKGPRAAPASVLVVEDNDINRQVLRDMLVRDGHRVAEARNGREGVEMAAREAFDLILMDLRMPELDGYAAARAIRGGDGASRGRPIFALTANAPEGGSEAAAEAGFDGILYKPLARADLRSVLAGLPRHGLIDPGRARDLAAAAGVRFAAFRDRFDAELGRLVDAPPPDASVLAEDAHRAAGTAAIFGATRCHAILGEIERAARDGDDAAARRALAALRGIREATIAELRAIAAKGVQEAAAG